MEIGSLTGSLILTDAFSSTLNLAIQKIESAGEKISKVGSSFQSAGATLTAGITAPLAAAAAGSLLFSSNFEASMTRLVSLAGVSSGELEGVKQHILDLAPAVGIGPQALADAMTVVSSTISDTTVAMEILDIAAKGSAAGLGETKDVAKALTSVINSYGKDNITAAQAADILTKAVQDGGAEAKELAPTLANVVPIAAQLGISFTEVAANIATVTKLGTPAAEAVTQLSSVMSATLKETKQGTDALAKYGMSYESLRRSIKENGLQATLDTLVKTFGNNTTALTDVFGRVEALRNVMGSAGQQSATYAEEIKRIGGSAGSLNSAFDAMKDTQVQTWNQLSAAVGVAAIKFGDALAPAMKSILEAAKPLLQFVVDAAGWFSKLPQPVQTTAIAIASMTAAVGPLVFVTGSVLKIVGALATALPLLGTAFALATGPIGLTVIAVTGLVAAVAYFLKQKDAVVAAGQDQSKQFNATAKSAEELAKRAKELADCQPPLVNGFKVVIPVAAQTGKAVKGLGDAHAQTTEQINEANAAAKKSKEAWIQYNSVVGNIQDQLAAKTIEAIKYDLQRGIEQSTLASIYKVTAEQVGAVAKLMDKEKEASQNLATVTGLNATAHRGLTEQIGELSNADKIVIDRFNEHYAVLLKIHELNMQARDGFTAVGISLEDIGQKSNEIDVLRQRIAEAGETVKGKLADALGKIPDLLIQSFTGGGGLAGAAKAAGVMIAQAIIEPISKGFSTAQKEAIGFGAGLSTALGQASGLNSTANTIVGVGTGLAGAAVAASSWGTGMAAAGIGGTIALSAVTLGIGAAAIGTIALIKHFSGVSKEIKEARKDALDFEQQIWNTLTAAQALEAGGETWKATVIATRDAYLAVGLSAGQAEADVQALWDATNKGPEAVKAATDKINAAFTKQKQLLDAVHAAGYTSRQEFQALATKAAEVYEYMLRSGQYTAEQLQQAFEASARAQAIAAGDASAIAAQAAEDSGFKTRAEYDAIAKKAEETYIYMRDSGLYTAAEVQKAWEATQKAQEDAYDDATSSIKGLVDQYQTLADSISDEAPEEIMGVIESQTRAQMEVLKKQGEEQLRQSGMNAEEAARAWEAALGSVHIDPVHIPVVWDVPDFPVHGNIEVPEPADSQVSYAAAGAVVTSSGPVVANFASRGTDTEPYMLSPGEQVLSPSQRRDFQQSKGQSGNQDVVNSIQALTNVFVGELPRALARSVSTELAGLRIGAA